MAAHWDKVRWRQASTSSAGPHESGLLKLNCDKALHYLEWHATWDFQATVQATALWYRRYYETPSGSMADFSLSQIVAYAERAQQQGMPWSL
jgi:CDP-glucose 4,6-dehydratase